MTKQELRILKKYLKRDIRNKEENTFSNETLYKYYNLLKEMGYEIVFTSDINDVIAKKAIEVFGKENKEEIVVNKPIKIRKYGKNLKSLEKLMKIESTKVYFNGHEAKGLFEKLIGFEFIFKPCKCGFDATGPDGESFKIETTQILEFI